MAFDHLASDEVSADEVEQSLRAALTPVDEQIARLDAAILSHERHLSELRDLRRRANGVRRALDPTTAKPGPKGPRDTRPLAEATRARVSVERAGKLDRVRQHVLAMGPGVDITSEIFDAVHEGRNGTGPLSRGFLYDALRELRDDGVLRLDRSGNGGQAIYRLVE